MFVKFEISEIFQKFSNNLRDHSEKICEKLQICLREYDFLVDLDECCKMRIWTRKSALIQPRTGHAAYDAQRVRLELPGPVHDEAAPLLRLDLECGELIFYLNGEVPLFPP